MSDEPHNIIIDYLKQLRAGQARIENDIQDIKFRVGQLEEKAAHHTKRFDRMDERLAKIEVRFDLVDA